MAKYRGCRADVWLGPGQRGGDTIVSRRDGPSDEEMKEMTVLRAAQTEQTRRADCYPDLLAALESASCGRYKPCGDWLHDPNNSNCSLTIARAAIAKAQGET
mgnify:CR=1 FL=1